MQRITLYQICSAVQQVEDPRPLDEVLQLYHVQ